MKIETKHISLIFCQITFCNWDEWCSSINLRQKTAWHFFFSPHISYLATKCYTPNIPLSITMRCRHFWFIELIFRHSNLQGKHQFNRKWNTHFHFHHRKVWHDESLNISFRELSFYFRTRFKSLWTLKRRYYSACYTKVQSYF